MVICSLVDYRREHSKLQNACPLVRPWGQEAVRDNSTLPVEDVFARTAYIYVYIYMYIYAVLAKTSSTGRVELSRTAS